MTIDRTSILKAVNEAKKSTKKLNFIQAFDLILTVKNVDLKKPENRINELIELPHSPKLNVKIIVFASGDLALRAEKAGADKVLGMQDLEHFANDKKSAKKMLKDTDFFLAETSLMATVGKVLGPILGPKGKMPTPVPPTASIETVIARHKKSVRLRMRDQPNAQISVGTEEMSENMIADNIQTVISFLERRLTGERDNIRAAYVKTTMGPPSRIML